MASQQAAKDEESAADPAAEDAHYYRQVLHDLIDMGTDLARMVHQQAKAQAEAAAPGSAPTPDPTIPFDRIARTVRRTITLARKLDEPVRASATTHRLAARKRIIREVEDAIQRDTEAGEAETLHAELHERLDAPDLDDDLDHRPVAEIITEICRDLGIAALPGTHPWKRRTPADIAALHARAARPRATQTPGPVQLDSQVLGGTARFRGG